MQAINKANVTIPQPINVQGIPPLLADCMIAKAPIMQIKPIPLPIKLDMEKNEKLNLTDPATIHNKSSGNTGKITVLAYYHLPFSLSTLDHLS